MTSDHHIFIYKFFIIDFFYSSDFCIFESFSLISSLTLLILFIFVYISYILYRVITIRAQGAHNGRGICLIITRPKVRELARAINICIRLPSLKMTNSEMYTEIVCI